MNGKVTNYMITTKTLKKYQDYLWYLEDIDKPITIRELIGLIQLEIDSREEEIEKTKQTHRKMGLMR